MRRPRSGIIWNAVGFFKSHNFCGYNLYNIYKKSKEQSLPRRLFFYYMKPGDLSPVSIICKDFLGGKSRKMSDNFGGYVTKCDIKKGALSVMMIRETSDDCEAVGMLRWLKSLFYLIWGEQAGYEILFYPKTVKLRRISLTATGLRPPATSGSGLAVIRLKPTRGRNNS